MKRDRDECAGKQPSSGMVDQAIADAVKKASINNKLTCRKAEQIARALGKSMGEVGLVLDRLEISITECQLGLFGYHPEKSIVSPAQSVGIELESAIMDRLTGGRLPCEAAWEISRRQAVLKTGVAAACEFLKTKIKPCQLGAF